jgi:hypothetical protein
MPRIVSVHPDGTDCTHPYTPSGKPRDPNCPGRRGFRTTCPGCRQPLEASSKVVLTDKLQHGPHAEHQTAGSRTR